MHLLKIRLGQWEFAPALWPTLAALLFFVLTMWLGGWQTDRAAFKRDLQARYDQAGGDAPVHLGSRLLDRDSVLHRRVEVRGTFDDARTILLDNKVYNGVAGYHVLTPLMIEGSQLAILVNRGWVGVGRSRNQLPQTAAPRGEVSLMGMAVDPHSRYLELKQGTSLDRVWQNLDFERYAASFGLKLQPVVLLQSNQLDDGLIRDWPRPDSGANMHASYAFQWYSLATTLVVLWLVLNVKRRRDDGS